MKNRHCYILLITALVISLTSCQTKTIDDGPFRLGVVICKLNSEPRSVAARVLEGRKNHNPKFDVDLYVSESDSVGDIVQFLQELSSAGVSDRVRVVVRTSDRPVTFEQFNNRPLGTSYPFSNKK